MKHTKWISVLTILSLSGSLLAGCAPSQQANSNKQNERQIVRADTLNEQEKLIKTIGILIDKGEAFDSGTYKAGKIPKGEYVFLNFNNVDTPARYQEKNGGESYFQSFGYVDVAGDKEVKIERGILIPVKALEELNVDGAKALYEKYNGIEKYDGPGYYKIGKDLPKGEVIVQATSKNSYASLLTSPVRKKFNTLAVQHINKNITIDTNDAEYINITDAKIIKINEGVSTKKMKQNAQVKAPSTKKQDKAASDQYYNLLYVMPDIYVENSIIMFMAYSLMLEMNYYLNMMEYSQHLEFVNHSKTAIERFDTDYKRTKVAIDADRAIENKDDASKKEKEEAEKVQKAAKDVLTHAKLAYVGTDGEGSLDDSAIKLEKDGIIFDGVSITNDGQLSNGKKETVSLYFNGAVVAEREVTVDHLDKKPKEDNDDIQKSAEKALKKAKVTFNGTNGSGFMVDSTITEGDYTFTVTSDNRQDLSNGDKVPMYLIYQGEQVGEREIEVTGLSKETESATDNDGYTDKDYPKDYKESNGLLDSDFEFNDEVDDILSDEIEDGIYDESADGEDIFDDEDDDSDSEDDIDLEEDDNDSDDEEEDESTDESTEDSEDTSDETEDSEDDEEESRSIEEEESRSREEESRSIEEEEEESRSMEEESRSIEESESIEESISMSIEESESIEESISMSIEESESISESLAEESRQQEEETDDTTPINENDNYDEY